jgi:putative transposase
VSEATRELAMSRFRLIEPYLEERRSLQLVAADANLSFRTAQRWVSQYRKFGLTAFVRKPREDRGGRRVVSSKIKAAIEGLALERPPLPIRSICRQVRAFAQATGEPMPKYGTVYDLVRELPSGLLIVDATYFEIPSSPLISRTRKGPLETAG